jgi:hypothetical protein
MRIYIKHVGMNQIRDIGQRCRLWHVPALYLLLFCRTCARTAVTEALAIPHRPTIVSPLPLMISLLETPHLMPLSQTDRKVTSIFTRPHELDQSSTLPKITAPRCRQVHLALLKLILGTNPKAEIHCAMSRYLILRDRCWHGSLNK